MKYTFKMVDFSEKKPKKRSWIEDIPQCKIQNNSQTSAHKKNFHTFTAETENKFAIQKSPKLNEVETIRQKINKKLENTSWTVQLLEEKFNNETMFHVLMDMKGNSIWFNVSYMEYTGRNETMLMQPNFLNTLLALNKDHPMCDVLINLLQQQPQEFIGKKILLTFQWNLQKLQFQILRNLHSNVFTKELTLPRKVQ
jgi:hypothetical protein